MSSSRHPLVPLEFAGAGGAAVTGAEPSVRAEPSASSPSASSPSASSPSASSPSASSLSASPPSASPPTGTLASEPSSPTQPPQAAPPPHCEQCPLYAGLVSGEPCATCGRGANWWSLPPLLVWGLLFVLLLRFTAMLLGAEPTSLQRDFRSREGEPFWRVEPLASYCEFPLSVYEHPAQIAVLAALLGATMLTPLLVSRLYGRPAGVGFVMLAVALGAFPWLALAVLPGCLLMASTGWLTRQRTPVALALALLPVVLYIGLVVYPSRDLPTKTPMARSVPYFPWLLAAPGAVLTGWVLLTVARWVGYRVWITMPVAAGVCAVPVVVFFVGVGRAELEFALIRRWYNPKVRFEVVADRSQLAEQLRRRGVDDLEQWWDSPTPLESLSPSDIRDQLLPRMQRETLHRCQRFLTSHPQHYHAADVLYYAGLTADATFDERTFAKSGAIRFDAAEITEDGRPFWEQLVLSHSDHPLMVVAEFRLARQCVVESRAAMARGDLGRAAAKLREAEIRLDTLPTERARFATLASNPSQTPLQGLLASFGIQPSVTYEEQLKATLAEAELYRRTVVADLAAELAARKRS